MGEDHHVRLARAIVTAIEYQLLTTVKGDNNFNKLQLARNGIKDMNLEFDEPAARALDASLMLIFNLLVRGPKRTSRLLGD